ncbi:hypothetical protein [Haladaptatus sp. NG-WS-4]
MADDTTDAEGDDSEHEETTGGTGSGFKTVALMGLSFAAGYLVGRSQGSKPNLREELDAMERADEGPMEIEIRDTGEHHETESNAENEETESDESASGEDESA